MNENNQTDPQTSEACDMSAQLETTVKELLSLGQVWASYGLCAGKHALEATARSQETLARLLGDLADHIHPDREDHSS